MQITDEMVRIAFNRYEGSPMHEDCPQAMRAALQAVAPLIAKAEAEEIAAMADDFIWCESIDWWLTATKKEASAESCRRIAAAIRARHATPTEKDR